MLEVGAETSIDGHCRPFIVEKPSVRLADIYHGLNREHHALTQSRTMSTGSIIGNLRLFVQPRSDSVTYKLANHAKSIRFDHLLHGRAHVANGAANPSGLDRTLERCLGYIEQLLDLRLHVI